MLLNLSITLISLLASSAVSCINIRVKLTYSLASYCRFVLNSHPQQNIEPLYSYIYQNSAIYTKGKQFYLFDLLLFCYLLFFILYLKMTVFSQWLKGRNIWFWIFGWSQFMLFGFTGTSLTTESYRVSLLCFSWWGGCLCLWFGSQIVPFEIIPLCDEFLASSSFAALVSLRSVCPGCFSLMCPAKDASRPRFLFVKDFP